MSQLTQIMDHLSAARFLTHPVLLMGDLNIVGGGSEYNERFQDLFNGWGDPVAAAFGNTALPFTNDKTSNAYGHFWEGNHLLEHSLQRIYHQSGEQVCRLVVAQIVTLNPDEVCRESIPHPMTQNRLDYILIRQGRTTNWMFMPFSW
jgi:hypothetical protein